MLNKFCEKEKAIGKWLGQKRTSAQTYLLMVKQGKYSLRNTYRLNDRSGHCPKKYLAVP